MKTQVLTEAQFMQLLSKRRAGRPLRVLAAELGVSHQYLGHVFTGAYGAGPAVAAALGYEQVTGYRKAKGKPKSRQARTAKPKPRNKNQMQITDDLRLKPIPIK